MRIWWGGEGHRRMPYDSPPTARLPRRCAPRNDRGEKAGMTKRRATRLPRRCAPRNDKGEKAGMTKRGCHSEESRVNEAERDENLSLPPSF